MSCRCAIRFLNFYFHPCSHIRVEKWRFFSESCSWTPSIFQGIVNKWYARMWLVRPCRCSYDSRSHILLEGVKNRFKKNNISLIWHRLISLLCYYPPWKKMWPFISTYLIQGFSVSSLVEIGQVVLQKKIFKSRQCIFSMWLLSPLEKMQGP